MKQTGTHLFEAKRLLIPGLLNSLLFQQVLHLLKAGLVLMQQRSIALILTQCMEESDDIPCDNQKQMSEVTADIWIDKKINKID
jgi:hypothetical protein